MFIRQRHPRIDEGTKGELWACLSCRAFEGQIWKGCIWGVIADAGVVDVCGSPLDCGYYEVANCGCVLLSVLAIELRSCRELNCVLSRH